METATGGEAPTVELADELVDEASISDGRVVVRFSRTQAALADLEKRFKGAAFDMTTTRGNDAARAARRELTSLRTGLEAKRKSLKGPAVEFGRLIDSQALALKIAIEALEGPIDFQIKADETRREEERQAKLAAEQKRCDDHRARIADISAVATRAVGLPSAEIQAKIDLVTRIEIDATFEEFEAAAGNVKHETLLTLRELHAVAVRNEAAVAEAEANKILLAKLQQEINDRRAAEQLDEQRKADEEKRVQAAKQAADAVRQIQSNLARELIEEIRRIQARAFTTSADGMLELVTLIEEIKIGDDLGDFEGSAQKAKEDALVTMHEFHKQAVDREAEKRGLEQAAAELARQQKEWLAAHPPAAPAPQAESSEYFGWGLKPPPASGIVPGTNLTEADRGKSLTISIDGGGEGDQFAAAPYVVFDPSQQIEFMEAVVLADMRVDDTPMEEFIESLPQAMEILGVDVGHELPRHVAAASKYDTSDTAPMLSTGDIGRRLGLDTALPVATIEGVLGVPRAGQEKRAVLWRASQWPAIVDALLAHIGSVR